jgi:hypothetical protein
VAHAAGDMDDSRFSNGEFLQFFAVFTQCQLDDAAEVGQVLAVTAGEKEELVKVMGVIFGDHFKGLGDGCPVYGEFTVAEVFIAGETKAGENNFRVMSGFFRYRFFLFF